MSSPTTVVQRRYWILFASIFIAGCASRTSGSGHLHAETVDSWSGRVSVNGAAAEQNFSAAFVLSGNARQGQLLLSSALGVSVAEVQWDAQGARVQSQGQTRQYDSMAELTAALTGAALPLAALFAWLRGDPVMEAGWQPDLREWAHGRVRAQRHAPWESASLRVVLDEPPPEPSR